MLFRTRQQVLDFLDYMDGRGIVFEDMDLVNEALIGFGLGEGASFFDEHTDKNYMKTITKLFDKWEDLNKGLTTDELEQLKTAFEVGLTDVETMLKNRKYDELNDS